MSRIRRRLSALLLASGLVLGLSAAVTVTAAPAHALVFTQQCTPPGQCMNFWNGNLPVKTFSGTTGNNNITIHWLSGGGFELRDNLHGGCIADQAGLANDPDMEGGLACPSLGNAPWGSIFTVAGQCGNGFSVYKARHWAGYVTIGVANGQVVTENGAHGTCIKQES